MFWFIVVFVLGIIVAHFFDGRWNFWGDHNIIPTPPKTGGVLLFIHERQDMSVDQDLLLRKVPDYVTEHKLDGFRSIDEEQPEIKPAIDFAASKGISPPCVVYVDRDQNMVSAIRWPESIEGLGRL